MVDPEARRREVAEAVFRTVEVLKHVARLWGFDVRLENVDALGRVTLRDTAPGPKHHF